MARAAATVQRLHVTADLRAGGVVDMDVKQAHYLRNVLRLEVGAPLLVFNGRDGEWRGVLEIVTKKQVSLRLVEQSRAQDAPSDIWLLIAPVKKERLDYLAQKATEMGVGRLQPVITARTQGGKSVKLDKLAANVIEAAEQCNIMSLPHIEEPLRLDQMLRNWAADTQGRQIIFCDEDAASGGLRANAPALIDALKGQKLALLIGPEGGFDEAERDALKARDDVHSLSLGPRILRTDTAMVAAMALLQAALGDW
jgi:16S rRNA (uracil1498-N3)-methyltransferase